MYIYTVIFHPHPPPFELFFFSFLFRLRIVPRTTQPGRRSIYSHIYCMDLYIHVDVNIDM